jgi:hypothetical protein
VGKRTERTENKGYLKRERKRERKKQSNEERKIVGETAYGKQDDE